MRNKIIIGALIIAAGLLIYDIPQIMERFPDERNQGPIYRIIFFHVPAAWTAFVAFFAAMIGSIAYLKTKNLKYDAFAAAVTEVGLAFGAANLITGMIWAKMIWGVWWVWDPRLTSMLIGWLIYAGYLMLRNAIEEPTERAKMAAVLSIFAFADVPIIWFSIQWWRTNHPQPIVFGAGKRATSPEVWAMLFQNWVPLLLIGLALLLVRMQQESMQRELDALRREAHAF